MKKKLMSTVVILCILAFSAQASRTVRFAVIGDRSGSVNQEEFQKAVTDISRMHPDFVITVGDIPDDAIEEDWLIALKTLSAISSQIYYTPGNNDIIDDESAQRFTEHTGFKPYYSFDKDDIHFLVLDNSIAETVEEMGEEQLKWAEKDLKRNRKASLTIVFMHKPFWADNIARGKPDKLHDLFKKYGVDAVFSGHWHQYAHNTFDGISYYLVGSSGGGFPFIDESLGMFYQYMWCTVEEKTLYPVLMKSGHTVDTDIMTIEEEQTVYALQSGRFITSSCIEEGFASLSVANINDYPINIAPILISDYIKELPAIPKVTIAPGAKWKYDFNFKPEISILHTPVLSFDYTFGREKIYKHSAPITLIRKFTTSDNAEAPLIDGTVKSGEWDGYTQTDDFYPTGDKSGTRTSLYIGKDKKYLYAAVVCYNSPGEKTQSVTKRDAEVFKEPSAGFLITSDGVKFINMYVNEAGTIWDMLIDRATGSSETKWNGNIETAAVREGNHWSVELKIPLEDLNADATDEIFLNFKRKEPGEEDLYLTLPWDLKFKTFAVIK